MVRPSWLSLLLACVACGTSTTPRTELVVVVDSDLSVPSELDGLRLQVQGPTGKSQTAVASLADGGVSLPRTLVLAHETGALGPFSIRAVGTRGTEEVSTRTARVSFESEATLTVSMNLLRTCVAVSCMLGETCTESGCRSDALEASELLPWSGRATDYAVAQRPPATGQGGAEARAEAGIVDGAAEDAAVEDAASEADADVASEDAGMCVPEAESCNGLDDDCDEVIDNGYDLDGDELNCGRCGNRCSARRNEVCCRGTCARTCNQ